MKKAALVALVLLDVFCAFAAAKKERFFLGERFRGLYVNAKDGADVFDGQGAGARKIAGLVHGDYVVPVEIGGIATIGGIEDYWVKIALYPEDRKDGDKREFGWVFGGHLTEGIVCCREEELKTLIRRRGYHHAPDFQDDWDTNYMVHPEEEQLAERRDMRADYEAGGWRGASPHYERALPNYFTGSGSAKVFAVTVREALFLDSRMQKCGDEDYWTMKLLPPFTKLELADVLTWGIELKTKTLYPVYLAFLEGRLGVIRGIDIASVVEVSTAFNGKNEFSLAYQVALTNVRNDRDGRTGCRREEIEKALNDEGTYRLAYIGGSSEITAVCFRNGWGRCFSVPPKDLNPKGSLRILYPLNISLPPKIIEQTTLEDFDENGGTATFSRTLYTLDDGGLKYYGTEAKASRICTYSATVSGGSGNAPRGVANHFFDGPLLFVHEFQTDKGGRIVRNGTRVYERNRTADPYRLVKKYAGEPRPFEEIERGTHKKGGYANPVCRLKVRSAPSLGAKVFGTLEAGTLLRVVEVGGEEEIDGISARWLKVEPVNPERFVEGRKADGGWVFGGYLE